MPKMAMFERRYIFQAIIFGTPLKLTCPLKINGLEDVFPTQIVTFLGDIRSFSGV